MKKLLIKIKDAARKDAWYKHVDGDYRSDAYKAIMQLEKEIEQANTPAPKPVKTKPKKKGK